MWRCVLLLVCLGGPAVAGCDAVAGTTYKVKADGSVLEVNLFPISANATTLTYAACPVVAHDELGEATDCQMAVADRDGGPTTLSPLGQCSAADGWSTACPDFTAEGFTAGNRAALADLVEAENLSCPQSAMPRPLAQQAARGGKGLVETYRAHAFEVVAGCTDLTGTARRLCDGGALRDASVFAFEAAGRTTVCAMDEMGQLSVCSSD